MCVAATNVFDHIEESRKETMRKYNFEHFRSKHLFLDAWATLSSKGIPPGEIAPDFTMAVSGGGSITLSELRGKPVLLATTGKKKFILCVDNEALGLSIRKLFSYPKAILS